MQSGQEANEHTVRLNVLILSGRYTASWKFRKEESPSEWENESVLLNLDFEECKRLYQVESGKIPGEDKNEQRHQGGNV